MRYQRREGRDSGEEGARGHGRWAAWELAGSALAGARGGGAALTARFRPSAGADNGVAVPGAPSHSWAARVRPLSPKLLSI